jgi:hypothetical protein
MSEILDFMNQLPATARFSIGTQDRATYDQAIRNGWTPEQLAEGVCDAITAPNVRSKTAMAVTVLHRLAGQAPPPVRKPVDGVRGVGLPMPECGNCGQPFGRKGGLRPRPGSYPDRTCPSCTEPLLIVQYVPLWLR